MNELYDENAIQKYNDKIIREGKSISGKGLAPNVYAIAAATYSDLFESDKN